MERVYNLLIYGILLLNGFALGEKFTDVNLQLYRTMSNYQDLHVNPCDNFYQYACGNWKNIHSNDDYYETLGLLDFKANYVFARIFKSYNRQRHNYQYKFVQNVLNYYNTCRNMLRKPYKLSIYLTWLQDHENITWPMPYGHMRQDNKSKALYYDWLHLIAVLRKYGLNGVFWEEIVIQNRNNSRQWLIDLDKPILNDSFKSLSFESLRTLLSYLNIKEHTVCHKVWRKIRQFEAKLHQLDDIEDIQGYHYITVKELNSTWINRYLTIVLEDNNIINTNFKISIQNLPYMEGVQKLLASYDPMFIGFYIMLRFLTHLSMERPTEFTSNWCVQNTRSHLPLAMNWLYEEYHGNMKNEGEQIREIFSTLLEEFRLVLRLNKNGFNESILQYLEDKSSIGIKIGNLPHYDTADKIEAFYKNLTLHKHSFYENHLKMLYFDAKIRHRLLHETGNSSNVDDYFYIEDFEMGVSSSPYFLPWENLVIVPLTLLQFPLFHSNLHDVFKYSSIGFLLAHEITHAFDDSGIDFDKMGNKKNAAPAIIRENENFLQNLECLRKENPEVIDEKIADVNGLRLTYEACFKNISNTIDDGHGGEIDTAWVERLFFLNFALFFCGDNSTPYADEIHGSDEQRVIDTLSNFAEFSRVYNCPLGSTMNPETKCQVWR